MSAMTREIVFWLSAGLGAVGKTAVIGVDERATNQITTKLVA